MAYYGRGHGAGEAGGAKRDGYYHVPRMSADILGTNCDQCLSMVQCCFTATETIRLIRTWSPGRTPRLSHSSWTLDGY